MSQHSTGSATGPGPNGRKYEDSSVSVHQLFWFAVGVVGLVVMGVLVSTVTFHFFEKMTPMGPNAAPFEDVRQMPGDLRLQTDAPRDLEGYRTAQQQKLSGYGWVDQPAGVVHIPIDRAMEMMLQKGYPVRGSAQTSTTAAKSPNKAASPKAASAATGGKHS